MKVEDSVAELLLFATHTLNHRVEHAPAPMHRDWCLDLVCKSRIVRAAPREFAKSFYHSVVWPLYAAITGLKRDIVIVSATQALSKDWLRIIRFELENNFAIHETFGHFENPGGKWTEEEIVLANGARIRAKGKEYQLRGLHPDLIVLDDLETDESAASQELRHRDKEFFWNTVQYCLTDRSQLVVVGTILHPDSLLADLVFREGKDRGWSVSLHRALESDQSTWPSRHPTPKLLEERSRNLYAFERERQNNPLGEGKTLILREWRRTFTDRPEISETFMAIDPAVSDKSSADYTAISILGVSPDGNVYDLNSMRGHWLPMDTVRRVAWLWKTTKPQPRFVGLESVAAQRVFKPLILSQAPFMRILELAPDRDKRRRLESVIHFFQQGIFHSNNKDLWEELFLFPAGSHDDFVDSTVYCLSLIMQYARPLAAHLRPKSPELLARIRQRDHRKWREERVWKRRDQALNPWAGSSSGGQELL